MADFSKIDFSSDEFMFAFQDVGNFETENAGQFREIKAKYLEFVDKFNIPHDENISLAGLEEIIIELSQTFVERRTRRVNEFTQRRLMRSAT